jgi:4-hydroxy-tetrahydrodipicolinate synthase
VSVAAHLAGTEIAAMVAAAARGDWEEATRLHLVLAPLAASLFVEPNPMPVKGALDALWQPVGQPRLPLVAASPEVVQGVKEALAGVRASA